MGVKNGINAFGKKNYLGTFAPPFAVINDVAFLRTLPDRHWRAGVSEAIKAALIKDRAFFDFLEEHAAALKARDLDRHGTGHPALRRASPDAHRERRRSVRARLLAAPGLRPLVRAQARTAHRSPARPRRSGRDRHRARHDLLVSWRASSPKTTGGESSRCCRPWDCRSTSPSSAGTSTPRTTRRACCGGLDEFREHLGGSLTILMLRSIGAPFDVHEIRRDVMIRSIGVLRDFEHAHVLREERHERTTLPEPARPQGTGR